MTSPNIAVVRDQVEVIRTRLTNAGWKPANAAGELQSPDNIVWWGAGYVHGEYTVHASYRPTGAGPAQGMVRVRLTPAMVQAHPNIGAELAQDLHNTYLETTPALGESKSSRTIEDVQWPPRRWDELAR